MLSIVSTGCQNNISVVTTVPEGVEGYLYPTHCGSILGSLGMPECEDMKSPTSSQGTVLFNGLLDPSFSWGSLGRI
jgi:hypothetical protein